MNQLSMTGADWLSARDEKRQRQAQAARKKAALVCSKSLHAAADALGAFSLACIECNDASSPLRADDSRTLLAENMREYAGWLESVYEKGVSEVKA